MVDHYCEFVIFDLEGGDTCSKIARFTIFDLWYCADHYDAIVESDQLMVGTDPSPHKNATFRIMYGG